MMKVNSINTAQKKENAALKQLAPSVKARLSSLKIRMAWGTPG